MLQLGLAVVLLGMIMCEYLLVQETSSLTLSVVRVIGLDLIRFGVGQPEKCLFLCVYNTRSMRPCVVGPNGIHVFL